LHRPRKDESVRFSVSAADLPVAHCSSHSMKPNYET